MALTIALAAVAVVRLADQSPAAQASAESVPVEPLGFELLAGPGAPRFADSSPPEVPPPPPLAGSKPRIARPVRTFVPDPVPDPPPLTELRAPIILGLDQGGAVPDALPLEKVVVTLSIPEPEPVHPPVIVNLAKLHRREHPAMRFVKSVGRVFGFAD